MTLAISTADIVERFRKGETIESLAVSYQCHRGTILYRLNQAGARSRTRARVNARVMLATHKPVLVGLLAQLEKALEALRGDFAAVAGDRDKRKKWLSRIERMEAKIFALKAVTTHAPG